VLALGGTAAALVALLQHEGATQALLARVPGVERVSSRGSLLGGDLELQELRMVIGQAGTRLTLQGAQLGPVRLHWRPHPGAWLGLELPRVAVQQLQVDPGTASDEPLAAFASLRLPVALTVGELTVARLQPHPAVRLEGLKARIALGDEQGSRHRVVVDRVSWPVPGDAGPPVQLAATASLGADAPLLLALKAQGARDGGAWPWRASVEAAGPLASFDLKARVAGAPAPEAPSSAAGAAGAPALDLVAQLRPFERWPLGDVSLTTRELDLSALAPTAPRTRLSGHVVVRSQGLRDPVSADLQLDNARALRLDEGGLPLLSLRGTVKADPRQPQRLVLGPFELEAADSRGSAGRWSGNGVWNGAELQLDSRLTELQPARLDQRLAAMRLSGPLRLTLQGLPRLAPDPGAAAPAAWAGWGAVAGALQTQLSGSVSGAPQEVQVTLDAQGDARQLTVRQLKAVSGRAQVDLSAQLQRQRADRGLWQAGQRWRLDTRGSLADFDPAVWFPGHPALAGPAGAHRLNGRWSVDLDVPAPEPGARWTRWLPQWQGQADVALAESRWAGLPLQADLQLRQDPRDPAQRSQARADLRLGSSQLQLDGRADPLGPGDSDRTQLRLNAPALAEVAPLMALVPTLRPWVPRQGSLQADAEVRGRWPALRADVQAQAAAVRAGRAAVDQARVQVRWDGLKQDELGLQLDATALRWAEVVLDRVRAEVSGTLGAHRLEADVAAPLVPPPALAAALAWRRDAGVQARLQGQAGWTAQAAGGGTWRFSLDDLGIGARARAGAGTADRSWLAARALSGEIGLDSDGQPVRASLAPGRLDSGVAALSWRDAQWSRLPGQPARASLKAALEPVVIAPLIERLQPVASGQPEPPATPGGRSAARSDGWGGSLALAATLDLRLTPQLEADLAVQRQGGDLVLRDAGTELPLGIDQAEARLTVRDGLWRLQPRLHGLALGRLDGELTLRDSPDAHWPGEQAALGGRLRAEVGTLAAWGGWLPPGWRLLGDAQAEAQIGGTRAAPQLNGYAQGQRIALRNPLLGVDFADGELRIAFDGDTARIERASLRGGSGLLTAEGQARLGAQPQLRLQARADKLRVLGRIDRQLVLSGQATVHALPQRLQVDGRIQADSGLFDLSRRDAPTLDEDVDVRREAADEPEMTLRREPGALARQLQLAVDVDLGRQLRLRGRGLDTLLGGSLKLTAPGGRLAVNGQVRALDGTYAAYGQKLGIERGLVLFEGPLDRTRLDILALRTDLDVRVGVAITGNALDPRVRLVSEPDLPDSDKLSWLVLGRGPEGLGRTDTALLQRAAMALLAGEGQGPVDGLLRRLGIDEFSIRQTDGEVRDTVVTVGKQLGRRWYVGYERGVNAATGTWQLVYRIAQRFTLRAQSGQDNSLDLIWIWRFATTAQRAQGAGSSEPR
jgi:translocation and assembly module TamB